jgi:bacillolysin
MKTKIITILCIAFAKLSFGQYDQYESLLTPYLSRPIESGYFYFTTPNNIQAGSLYQFYKTAVPDLVNDMQLIDVHTDSLVGLKHFKYRQLFLNVPVEGAGCIEHYQPDGSLQFINAKIADSIKSDGQPKISARDAIDGLLKKIDNDPKIVFAWEDPSWEQGARLDYADSSATYFPTAELIFAIDEIDNMTLVLDGVRYKLAYKISITYIQPEFETFNYFVDALTGDILKVRSTHVHDGPAGVYGYGSRIIDTQWKGQVFGGHYILKTNDATRVIHTKKNPSGQTDWWLLDNTTDGDDQWQTFYLTETSTHYHVSNSWDYFRNVFGRTGMNNQGREVRVRTQWSAENAQFIPSNGADHNDLRFGKSNGYDWGMEPSIVAHEFTHGVTHHSSHLEYEYESGALNESFSDMFGIIIQAVMMDNGATDWLLGNFVPYCPIRSLKEPNDYSQPNTYEGEFWATGAGDNGGVHTNSGVANHWFYILSVGEEDLNDIEDYYDVNGIGMTKAARIAYLALTSILQNSSQYTDARQATIQAAISLYGECSLEHQATVDAWYAVGVGAENTCTFTLDVADIDQDDLTIYPNPASESLNIELPYSTKEAIQIFDATGRLVQELTNGSTIFQTDISAFMNGMYTIRFSFNGNPTTKRFIVQK